MSNFVLSCCSTADLTKEHFNKRNISYLCFHYTLNGKNYLDDLGEKLSINKDNLAKKRVKVGDLVSAYGHIGILIGMDDKHYYIAESLEKDIHVLKMTESELIKSDWKWFVLMDDVYKEDGNLTNMWK